MALNEFLVEDLREIMRDARPAPVIELTPTGEMLSHEAMEIARFYHQASIVQQKALDAMVEAMEPQP